MTKNSRAKQLAYLEQRHMVAILNAHRWLTYGRELLEEQLRLAQEGMMREKMAERIRKLRAKGLFELAKEERDERLLKAIGQ